MRGDFRNTVRDYFRENDTLEAVPIERDIDTPMRDCYANYGVEIVNVDGDVVDTIWYRKEWRRERAIRIAEHDRHERNTWPNEGAVNHDDMSPAYIAEYLNEATLTSLDGIGHMKLLGLVRKLMWRLHEKSEHFYNDNGTDERHAIVEGAIVGDEDDIAYMKEYFWEFSVGQHEQVDEALAVEEFKRERREEMNNKAALRILQLNERGDDE